MRTDLDRIKAMVETRGVVHATPAGRDVAQPSTTEARRVSVRHLVIRVVEGPRGFGVVDTDTGEIDGGAMSRTEALGIREALDGFAGKVVR